MWGFMCQATNPKADPAGGTPAGDCEELAAIALLPIAEPGRGGPPFAREVRTGAPSAGPGRDPAAGHPRLM